MDRSSKPYDVGYGKPPKSGQFKPGQSGNKSGRPKANVPDDSFARALKRKHRFMENGQERMLTAAEIVQRQMIAKAAKGEFRSMAFIIDRNDRIISERSRKTRRTSGQTLTPEMLKTMSDEELKTLYLEKIREANGE